MSLLQVTNSQNRTANIVEPSLISTICQMLERENFQTTPLQFGTLKKIGESLATIIDKILEFFGTEKRINYKSDEAFGLVIYVS